MKIRDIPERGGFRQRDRPFILNESRAVTFKTDLYIIKLDLRLCGYQNITSECV